MGINKFIYLEILLALSEQKVIAWHKVRVQEELHAMTQTLQR